MTADNIPRVTICFSKNDDRDLKRLDQARGNIPRAKAIRMLLEYLGQFPDYLESFYKDQQNPPPPDSNIMTS